MIFKKNIFGQYIFVKKIIIRLFGLISYPRFNYKNTTDIQGSEILQNLPNSNVLIVSNHQTYFADVALMFHVIQSAIKGKPNNVRYPGFLFCKKLNLYFIAAEETMKANLLSKIFAYGGAITVKRSWRADGKNVKRDIDTNATNNISKALKDGWVISFPQGTTKPYVPGRKGTGYMIKENKPIVVPVVINGFRRAFDKKGLFIKKKGTTLSMWFKPPLNINYNDTPENILSKIMDAIEQSEKFQ